MKIKASLELESNGTRTRREVEYDDECGSANECGGLLDVDAIESVSADCAELENKIDAIFTGLMMSMQHGRHECGKN